MGKVQDFIKQEKQKETFEKTSIVRVNDATN